MKSLTFIIAIIFHLFFYSNASAEDVWKYYMDGNYIFDFTINGDNIYCATKNGLVIWNRHSKTYEINRYYSTEVCCVYQRNHFTTIAVDNYGTVWCGNGDKELYSFDGVDWRVFTMENSGLPWEPVSLHVDNDNILWISTTKGITRYDGNSWITYVDDSSGNVLKVLLGIDKNNVKWFRTEAGVSSFDGKNWIVFTEENGLTDSKVYAMTVGNDNVKWFSLGDKTIASYNGDVWKTHIKLEWLPLTIGIDKNQNLWCGTNSGIYFLNNVSYDTFTTSNSDLTVNYISIIVIDNDGIIWASHDYSGNWNGIGLTRYDGSEWSNWCIEAPEWFSIDCVTVDHNNVKWFGTNGGGLSSFDGKNWNTFTMADTVRIEDIGNLAADNDNLLWMNYSTEYQHPESRSKNWWVYGLLSYDGISWTKYSDETTGISSISVPQIAVDLDNVKWFGSTSFDGSKWKTYDSDGFGNKIGGPVAVDRENLKWFGATGGVSSFDGSEWKHYETDELNDKNIRRICVDKDNVKWFLNDGAGVFRFDGNTFTNIGSHENVVNLESGHQLSIGEDMAVDSNGVIWFKANEYSVGVAGAGLVSFDGSTWTYYSDDFWFTYSTWGLTVDHDNVKWLYGPKGIASYQGGSNGNGTTGIDVSAKRPESVYITSNYPNPFNSSTTIEFTISSHGYSELTIYTIAGQKVRELIAGTLNASTHSAVWDGNNRYGSSVSSGIYLLHVSSNGKENTRRIMLLK